MSVDDTSADSPTAEAVAPVAAAKPVAAAVDADFAELYLHEFGRIAGVVRSLVGRRDVAEEITQDAFVVAHDRWSKVSSYDRPQDFVKRVALNRAVSSLRRRGAEHRALAGVAGRRDEAGQLDPDEAPVWAHVRQLPGRQRQVVALVYVEDLSLDRVAEVLGISESSVKTHLQRARAALATALADPDAEDDPEHDEHDEHARNLERTPDDERREGTR